MRPSRVVLILSLLLASGCSDEFSKQLRVPGLIGCRDAGLVLSDASDCGYGSNR